MGAMEEKFQQKCAARDIPGVVLVASDATGKFVYQNAIGMKTPTTPMNLDTTFIMASCTKLMTSIAAMQCVERGQITLDEAVSHVLPELKNLDILTGFTEAGEPMYKKSTRAITLRQLLTHSSGLTYDIMHPLSMKWRAYRGEPLSGLTTNMMQDISLPLLYEPGTSWCYGVSLDWVGLLVARLNNTSLESYMEKYIWSPLGIRNITFHQEQKPDVAKNLAKLTIRTGTPNPHRGVPVRNHSAKVDWTDELLYATPTTEEVGGAGAIGNPLEYMKILTSLLAPSCPILKRETIDLMFTPQFAPGSGSLTAYEAFLKLPLYAGAFASQPPGTKVNWGLGGMLVLQDFEYGKKKGTMSWSGLPNLLWTVDREVGLACFYASNIVPFGDFRSAEMQGLFEREMYRRFLHPQEKL